MRCSDEPWGSSTTEEWVLQKLLCCLFEHSPSWLAWPRKGDWSSTKWNRKSPKLQESPSHLRTVGFILHCWLYSQVLWSGLSPPGMIFAVPSGITFSPGLCWKMTSGQPLVLALPKLLSPTLQCPSAKGSFSLPPQLEAVTPTTRIWFLCPHADGLLVLSQPSPAGGQWHLSPSAGTWWWRGAGDCGLDVGTGAWTLLHAQVFWARKPLSAHQWDQSAAKLVSLLAAASCQSARVLVCEGCAKKKKKTNSFFSPFLLVEYENRQ